MSIKQHIFPNEIKQLQEEAVRRATEQIGGPVGFYEEWPDENPTLIVTDDTGKHGRDFCRAIWEDETGRAQCLLDHKYRAQVMGEVPITECWLGLHNISCHLKENSSDIILVGGAFHVTELKNEALNKLQEYIQELSPAKQERLVTLWNEIPEHSESYAKNILVKQLELVGLWYVFMVTELSRFRYEENHVSHDLLIFLQSLLASIEIISIELKKSQNIGKKWDGRFEELLSLCETFSETIGTRIGNLGEPVFNYYPFGRVIHSCVELHRAKANNRLIDIIVNLEQTQDDDGQIRVPHIKMAKEYLNRTLHNVIDNAIKYSFRGTVEHHRRVEIIGTFKAVKSDPGYNIKISNYGIGIEQDELEKVFEPRYQGRLRKNEMRPGSGMGLSFVKKCVEEIHGGTITIESYQQKGGDAWLTIVNIWLPIHGRQAW